MIRCYVGIIALALSLLSVDAAAISRGTDRARGQAVWDAAVNGKTTTVGGGNGSMTVIAPYKPSTVDANGNVALQTGPGNVNVNGSAVPVSVNGTISKGDIANAAVAAAGCAVGGGGVAGAVVCGGAAIAIPIALNWMANAGVRVNPTTRALEVKDGVTTRSNGYQYNISGTAPAFPTPQLACSRSGGIPAFEQVYGVTVVNVTYISPSVCRISWEVPGNAQTWDQGMGVAVNPDCPENYYIDSVGKCTAGDPSGWKAASIADAVGLMNNSRIPNADIVRELDAAGQAGAMQPQAGSVKVTGPSSVQGPSTTSVTNNSTTNTTTTTTNNYTYNSNNITNSSSVTNSTTSTAVKNPDGTTTTTSGPTTSTTTTPGDTKPPEEGVPSDTALPPVPSLYERKYPNGMEGIWNDYKDQLKGTDLVSLVGKLMPNVGDGGSCPTWPINLELAQWASYGTHDVAPPCWIWDVAKAILILSALLLARTLVFGG